MIWKQSEIDAWPTNFSKIDLERLAMWKAMVGNAVTNPTEAEIRQELMIFAVRSVAHSEKCTIKIIRDRSFFYIYRFNVRSNNL